MLEPVSSSVIFENALSRVILHEMPLCNIVKDGAMELIASRDASQLQLLAHLESFAFAGILEPRISKDSTLNSCTSGNVA
jgi:hypothetical protein